MKAALVIVSNLPVCGCSGDQPAKELAQEVLQEDHITLGA